MNSIKFANEYYTVSRCGVVLYHKVSDNEYLFLLKTSSSQYQKIKVYEDFGTRIKRTEFYGDEISREMKKVSKLLFSDSKILSDATQNVKPIQYKVRSTQNILNLEWLVPIDLSSFNSQSVEWIKVVKDNNNTFVLENPKIKIDPSFKSILSTILRKL